LKKKFKICLQIFFIPKWKNQYHKFFKKKNASQPTISKVTQHISNKPFNFRRSYLTSSPFSSQAKIYIYKKNFAVIFVRTFQTTIKFRKRIKNLFNNNRAEAEKSHQTDCNLVNLECHCQLRWVQNKKKLRKKFNVEWKQ
jgi:hypothetical protein